MLRYEILYRFIITGKIISVIIANVIAFLIFIEYLPFMFKVLFFEVS